MLGWAVRQVVIWGGISLLLYIVIGARLPSLLSPPPALAVKTTTLPAAESPGWSGNTLVYHANRNGHVIIDGNVNGSPVRFLVDTGATVVALTVEDAAAAGFSHAGLRFKDPVRTAGGVVQVAPVTLRELRIGQFATPDVRAVVVENLSISLLGQSFLNRLASYQMRDGVLTLNWN
jgi:aspartyl protease family protein